MSKVRVGRELMGHTIFMRTSEEGEEGGERPDDVLL